MLHVDQVAVCFPLSVLKFTQRCFWRPPSFLKWDCVAGLLFPDVSKEPISCSVAILTPYSMEQSLSWEANRLNLQLIKKFPAFYGTRKFITVLTIARHLSLSWANPIQSPQPLPTSWGSILIFSSHLRLGLPNGLFPSGFPTKTLCTPLPSFLHTCHMPCPSHSSRLHMTT